MIVSLIVILFLFLNWWMSKMLILLLILFVQYLLTCWYLWTMIFFLLYLSSVKVGNTVTLIKALVLRLFLQFLISRFSFVVVWNCFSYTPYELTVSVKFRCDLFYLYDNMHEKIFNHSLSLLYVLNECRVDCNQ